VVSGEYPALLKKRALSMLRLAERLLGEGEYDLVVLHSEYAVQLYLKALLYRLTGEEYRGHNLRALLGALAAVLEEKGFREQAGAVIDFVRRFRRELSELEEGRIRSVYGVYEYADYQARRLLESAKRVIELLKRIEEEVFREHAMAP